ncbi:hypothetical protein D9615_001135 [Tricholomella constricta]|uniref:Uncharacterized protein n=1 Tax=Tricholomella constricta TaxID=117010 RepID=A0A8H5HLD9_9AGAR|nr:hypothetical protein D9615_001135 [Tricholomella constricta]
MTTTTTTTSTFVTTTIGGGQDVIWEGGSTSRSPHSLIISPNLDALLEYDEKVRGVWATSATREVPQSGLPVTVGLPPPPRRNSRKAQSPRSPTSPKVGSPLMQETKARFTAEENPYINPGPKVEERETRDSSAAGADEMAAVVGSSVDTLQPSNVSQPSRVDKLLGIGKLPFALFIDPSVSNNPRPPLNNLRERARAKGKLLKLKNITDSNQRPQMRQVNDKLVLDIRRRSTSSVSGVWTPPGLEGPQRRPLLSHGSRRSSTSSSSSTTTYGPASTIDPRISISSTIYPASSAHSHPHAMYYSVDPVPIMPSNRTSSLQPASPVNDRNNDRQSFMDILSPAVPQFTLPELHHHRTHSQPPSRTSSPKPPLPTAPKPIFNRSSPKISPQHRYDEPKQLSTKLPPTTNFLDLDERSDLIRKNRKLAQVFGQPPGPDAFPQQQESSRSTKAPVLPPISSSNSRHERGAAANLDLAINQQGEWLPALEYMQIHARRHSEPLSPEDLSFFNASTRSSPSPDADIHAQDEIRMSSPTSFIDLSDDLGSATLATPNKAAPQTRGRRPSSPSAQSLFENMSPEEQAEEFRRRKRDKLAKVHRFLGSRVPVNLVLGFNESEPSLPPVEPNMVMATLPENEEATRKAWLRRRRSSSAAAYSSTWSDEVDRIKEDLNMKEKAINVRRAQKMEKVFGVAPPQTLYHTRRSPSPSVSNSAAITGHKMISGWTSPGESLPPVTGLRNPNRSSYSKPKRSKDNRPGTSESNKALLPKEHSDSRDRDFQKRTSIVYSHYQDSLNSLNDIIDRDDRESLAELHEYLSSGDMTIPPPLQPFTRTSTGGTSGDRRLSNASSGKSERRRSLPARTSIMSIGSDYSISSPRPEVTDFQARRRRAAKLTQFFGVDYRELITDVLESIESGLEHERKRGTLNPEEVEDLLSRLRNLRTKRGGGF